LKAELHVTSSCTKIILDILCNELKNLQHTVCTINKGKTDNNSIIFVRGLWNFKQNNSEAELSFDTFILFLKITMGSL
jgi:hypothetical protein